jgi:hypothetical protein
MFRKKIANKDAFKLLRIIKKINEFQQYLGFVRLSLYIMPHLCDWLLLIAGPPSYPAPPFRDILIGPCNTTIQPFPKTAKGYTVYLFLIEEAV